MYVYIYIYIYIYITHVVNASKCCFNETRFMHYIYTTNAMLKEEPAVQGNWSFAAQAPQTLARQARGP